MNNKNNDLEAWESGTESFDSQVGRKSFGTSLERIEEIPFIFSFLGNLNGKKVIELGCGEGAFSQKLANRGAHVSALDGTKKHIEKASSKYPRVNFLHFDVTKPLPFRDSQFDMAVSRFVLMYIKNLGKLSRNIHQILKPNGKFIFSIIHPVYPYIYKLIGQKSRYLGFETYNKVTRGKIKIGSKLFPYYYRPIQDYINPFIRSSFSLTAIKEISPTVEFIARNPLLKRMQNKPVFLVLGFQSNS